MHPDRNQAIHAFFNPEQMKYPAKPYGITEEQARQMSQDGHRVNLRGCPNEPTCAITCVYPADEHNPPAAWIANTGRGGTISALAYLTDLQPEK